MMELKAIEELIALVEEDTGAHGTEANQPDDESVGWSEDGKEELSMTFGHVRRAAAELVALQGASITQIAELKGDNRLITPSGVLEDVIRRIERGIVTATSLIVITLDTVPDKGGQGYIWDRFTSNLTTSAQVALLAVVKGHLQDVLNGKAE